MVFLAFLDKVLQNNQERYLSIRRYLIFCSRAPKETILKPLIFLENYNFADLYDQVQIKMNELYEQLDKSSKPPQETYCNMLMTFEERDPIALQAILLFAYECKQLI